MEALELARSSNASRALVLATLMGLTSCTATTPTTPETAAEAATVEFVIDGDTIDVIVDGQEERVRLIGIDTPESVSRTVPEQCFGKEASDALTGLLPIGTEIRIERDADARDRFGRLLLYVYRATDNLFVNRWLIEQGFADALFFDPNTTFESDFISLRNEARAEGRGLWSACDGPDQPLE